MSPEPLISLQRRLAEAGRIRMGEKTEKGAPRRLTTWRITSPTQPLIAQAAGLYGGAPKEWESPVGPQWEVVTETADLPVLVMPGYSLKQSYEKWEGPSKCSRRCDGEEMQDGNPCQCNQDGKDECELHTRLTVALPELTTMLGWRLETKGQNAARELLASMEIVQAMSGGRPFIPARLRVVERRGQKDGQALRFVVPVIDLAVGYAELAAAGQPERTALPAGYMPLPAGPGVTLEAGLAAVTNEAEPKTTTSRSTAPIGIPVDTNPVGEPIPVPAEPDVKYATEPQRRKLFAAARDRNVPEDRLRELIAQVNAGNESTRELPRGLVDAVLTAIAAEPERDGQFTLAAREAGLIG